MNEVVLVFIGFLIFLAGLGIGLGFGRLAQPTTTVEKKTRPPLATRAAIYVEGVTNIAPPPLKQDQEGHVVLSEHDVKRIAWEMHRPVDFDFGASGPVGPPEGTVIKEEEAVG